MKSSRSRLENCGLSLCPCESGKPYNACCEPYHLGMAAPTAETLMRSRYSAYVLGLEAYLLQTWCAETRPETLNSADKLQTKWLGLKIKAFVITSESSATVEFVARYKIGGKAERLHECSHFKKINQRWYYVDGVFIS